MKRWVWVGALALTLACGDDDSTMDGGEGLDAGVTDAGEDANEPLDGEVRLDAPPLDGARGDAATEDGGTDDDAAVEDGGTDTGVPPVICGDGVVDPGEECDDGRDNAFSPDACRPDCTRPRCGDGIYDRMSGEQCDRGRANSDVTPDACRTDCTRPTCGDAVVDTREECDDGRLNSDRVADACRTNCMRADCGDGTVDMGEECDTGDARSDTEPLACRLDCTNSNCGDGLLDEGEACDDGVNNAALPNRCRLDCSLPRCGDGIRDYREQCDSGVDPNCNFRFCTWTGSGEAPIPQEYDEDGTARNACAAATPSLCSSYESGGHIWGAFFQTRVGPSDPCWEYFSVACNNCPYWTTPLCDMFPDPPPQCRVGISVCRALERESCPSGFGVGMCASPSFRNQSPPLYDPSCRDLISSRCESLARTECPTDIDSCAAWVTDGTAPDGCDWVMPRCEGVIDTACPSANLDNCSDMEPALSGRHAICRDHLMEDCAGWEEVYCPDASPAVIDAISCTERYDSLEIAYPDTCHTWLQDQCRGYVAAEAQDTYAESEGCPSETTEVNGVGEATRLDDSVSDPDRHDCPIYAYTPMPAALVPFDATPIETTLAEADVTLHERDLGSVAVGSCQEYVEQSFYTYETFRVYSERFYDDARRVYQLAYSEDPDLIDYAIGRRVIRFGSPFGHYPTHTPVLPGQYALGMDGGWTPKNDFYRLMWTQNAEIRDVLRNIDDLLSVGERIADPDAEARNADILARLSGQGEVYLTRTVRGPDDGWRHHERMNASYGERGISDEVLSYNWSLRDRFNLLMDERKQLVQQRDAVRVIIGGMDPIGDRIRADIAAIDKTIHKLLRHADERGCFRLSRDVDGEVIPHACDWAPQDFVEDVQSMFERAMEDELERCESLAPADFSTLSGGYTYIPEGSMSFRTETADPTARSIDFWTYLNRQEYTVQNLDDVFDTDDPERRPTYGESYGTGDTIGIPRWFGAGYDAGASWFLDFPPHPDTGEPDLCQIDAGADAHMQAWVDLATIRFMALDGGVDTALRNEMGDPEPRFATHLRVLGLEIWDEELSGRDAVDEIDSWTYSYNLVFDQQVGDEGFDESVEAPVFSLAGFDVVVRVGAAGRVGMDLGGELALALDAGGECGPGGDVQVGAFARPFGMLSGFAEVGIDLFVVEIGVGASLQIIELALPVEVSLGFTTEGPLRDTDLTVSAHGDLELEMLSGRVYAYADTWWKTYKKTLFRWSGPSWDIPLFHKDWSYPMGPLVTYCDINPSVCE